MNLISDLLLEDGQGLTEYLFILSAMVVVVVGILALVGPKVSQLYTEAQVGF